MDYSCFRQLLLGDAFKLQLHSPCKAIADEGVDSTKCAYCTPEVPPMANKRVCVSSMMEHGPVSVLPDVYEVEVQRQLTASPRESNRAPQLLRSVFGFERCGSQPNSIEPWNHSTPRFLGDVSPRDRSGPVPVRRDFP